MTDSIVPLLDAETLTLLASSVERYGQDKYGFEIYRAQLSIPPGFSEQAWRDYADMGWLTIPLALEDGGFDSHPVAIAALMRYAGEYLALEPLFASVVLCGRLLALCGEGARQRLDALSAGSRLFALAHAEDLADGIDGKITTLCRNGKLTGRKVMVLHGDIADELIVSARQPDGDGLVLFAVDVNQASVRNTCYRLVDGRGAASFEFDGAAAHAIGPQRGAGDLLVATLEDARLALCAEAHGAIRALNRQTLAYVKERRQFGRPIGANQALQHRLVELFMLEQETAAVIDAAQRVAIQAGPRRTRAIMGAVAHVMTAGRSVSHESVQMHGGIGTTDELAISHYFKRIMVINRLLGDRDAHVDAFARADQTSSATSPHNPGEIS